VVSCSVWISAREEDILNRVLAMVPFEPAIFCGQYLVSETALSFGAIMIAEQMERSGADVVWAVKWRHAYLQTIHYTSSPACVLPALYIYSTCRTQVISGRKSGCGI